MKHDAVAAQLGRILASPQFAHSERLSRFLKLAVQVAESGEALKEYRIGVDVFDRGKDFDPRTDPIVRVQASKLRSKLLEYYADGGANDPLVISVPKGSYAAEIREAARAAAPAPPPSATATAAPAAPANTRVAVLPFVSMSADPENEHFADGLTEELINRLTYVPALQVVARTSAFRFKNRRQDLREVGALLSVGSIVEGSVRRAGDQVRVTAQLVDVATGYHQFSRTYQRQFSDVFALQDELAQAVVDEIAGYGDGQVARVRKSSPPADLSAYVVYQRAMLALGTIFGDYRKAEQLFRDALALDPKFAPAWSGLAHTYWLLTWYWHARSAETWPLCKQAAEQALELDARAAEAHCALGLVESGFEWNWRAAETCFERAIELQPSLALTYPFYAIGCLLPQGKTERALAMIERSLVLDPLNPLYAAIAAFIYLCAGRYDEVHRLHTLGTDLSPAAPPTGPVEAVAKELEGRYDEAIADYRWFGERGLELPSFLGHALARVGRADEARACIDKVLASPVPKPVDVARVYSGLRDADEALRWLGVAVEQRAAHLLSVPPDPRFAWLRADPRFAAVLKPMNLPHLAA